MSRMGDANTGEGGQGQQTTNLGDTAAQVGQDIRQMGTQVRDVASQKYDQLRSQATDYYQQGRERATEWEQSLEAYVHEKPIQAVLMAAGVGVLLGLLWKRS